MNQILAGRKPIKLIKASDVRKHFTMEDAIGSMHDAFQSLTSKQGYMPPRLVTSLQEDALSMFLKPAYDSKKQKAVIKVLTLKEKRIIDGIPTIVGVVLLIDTYTGEIVSLIDGEYLTALRTGAASGLATKLLANPNASVMALFGCGGQGRTQLEAIIAVRDIKKIYLFDKNSGNVESLKHEMKNISNIEFIYSDDKDVLKECDIICTATNSSQALFKNEDLKKGVHINAIGSFKPNMIEIDPIVMKNSKIYVDQLEACLKECGDLIIPLEEGVFDVKHIVGEIGDYILGNIKGREFCDDITVFKSVGVAIQDFAVANTIYERSLEVPFGQEINFFE